MLTMEMQDGIAVIRMDDGKANAFSNAMFDALEPALDQAERDAAATVLVGRPGVFSGGFDLKVVGGSDIAARDALVMRGCRHAYRLYNFGKPLVAAATGHAIALGGVTLLACDTRIGGRGDFKFGLNETAIGMVLPAPILEMVRDRLAKDKVTEAAIQARIYDAEGAVEAGFLDKVVDAAQVETVAIETARKLGEMPSDSYAGMKRSFRAPALKAIKAALG